MRSRFHFSARCVRNKLSRYCHDVRPSVCWDGVHCDHTVHFSADWSLRLDVLGTLTPKHVHLFPSVFFPVPPGRARDGSEDRGEVYKLLRSWAAQCQLSWYCYWCCMATGALYALTEITRNICNRRPGYIHFLAKGSIEPADTAIWLRACYDAHTVLARSW